MNTSWRLVILAMAAGLLGAAVAGAQDRPTIWLAPAQPARWDVAGHIAWFGSNQSDVAPEWDRWYSAGAGGLTVGRYWTPHLKTDIAATVSRAGRIYISEPVVFGGRATFRTRERLIQESTLAGGVRAGGVGVEF